MIKVPRSLLFSVIGTGSLLLTSAGHAQIPISSLPPIPLPPAPPGPPPDYLDNSLPLHRVMTVDPTREVRVTNGIVGRDETIVSIPYAYRRTAVLSEDLIVNRTLILTPKPFIQLKAGAVGYWAGRFHYREPLTEYNLVRQGISTSPIQTESSDVWCFFGLDENDAEASACVQTNEDSDQYIFFGGSPWYISNINYFDTIPVTQLKFTEQPVKFRDDLRLEYRFREWDADDVDVLLFANGTQLYNRPAKREKDGSAFYRTPAGELKLTQFGRSRTEALATLTRVAGDAKPPSRTISMAYEPQQVREEVAKEFRERAQSIGKLIAANENLPPPILDVGKVSEDREGFFPIAWRDVVLTRTIRPHQLFVQKNSPLNRPDRFGVSGAVLFQPMNELNRRILCLNPKANVQQPPAVTQRMVHCIQDTDGDGKYEWLIKDPVFPQKPAFMLAEVYTHTDLRRTNPIEVEPAPSQDLPISTADLIATGIASRIMTPEGHYRPNIYRFSFKMRAPEYVKRPTTSSTVIKNFDVELDRNGAGQLRSSNGTLLIEVRNAKMDGSAEVRLHNILEPGIGPIFDRETDLQYARKFKQGFEAIAVNARTGQPIDMSVFMSPDE